MVTGHFIKVTNSASKKGKQLALDPLAIEKMQTLVEPAVNEFEGEKVSPKSTASGDSERDTQRDMSPDKANENGEKEDKQDEEDRKSTDTGFKYPYLREEDLEQGSSGGSDILKSLANTVASAINKAQTGTPSWSAYPSIHAAYQLSGVIKTASFSSSPPIQLKQNLKHRAIAPKGKLYQGLRGLESFLVHHNSDIKKERGGASDGKESQSGRFDLLENDDSDCQDDSSSSSKLDADCVSEENDTIKGKLSPVFSERGNPSPSPPARNGHSSFFRACQRLPGSP